MKKVVFSKNAPQAIGPYSQAIKANDFLFISGQLPVLPATGEFAAGGIESQTKQSLENLKAILAAENLSVDTVVKTTVFLKDMHDFEAMNTVYAKYFMMDCPARVCVQVAKLPKDALVEIALVAAY
jgi:2-iminobutanoate/2-iminopropanoate deaminase